MQIIIVGGSLEQPWAFNYNFGKITQFACISSLEDKTLIRQENTKDFSL